MAMTYSTDTNFNKYRKYRTEKNFVCFMNKNGKPNGMINISQGLMRKTTLSNKVIFAYDHDENKLVIIQSEKGNINITTSPSCAHASIRKFLLFCGFADENLPVGRFKASVDETGYIHVYLNCPLPNKGE